MMIYIVPDICQNCAEALDGILCQDCKPRRKKLVHDTRHPSLIQLKLDGTSEPARMSHLDRKPSNPEGQGGGARNYQEASIVRFFREIEGCSVALQSATGEPDLIVSNKRSRLSYGVEIKNSADPRLTKAQKITAERYPYWWRVVCNYEDCKEIAYELALEPETIEATYSQLATAEPIAMSESV